MKLKYKSGALTSDVEIPLVTQELLDDHAIDFYGNRYFVCETILESAARHFAELLSMEIECET